MLYTSGMMVPSDSNPPDCWLPPPNILSLDTGAVHVWRCDLDTPKEVVADARRVLSADELKRADRFYRLEHRNHFAVARGTLRALLGRYLNVDACAVTFQYGDKGKPSLVEGSSGIEFNVSHSGGRALYAFTSLAPIGVDIEAARPGLEAEKIAHRFFSEAESHELIALPEDIRAEGFYNCWTRKEAYIKAQGDGFSLSLKRFEVSLRPGDPPRFNRIDDEPDLSRWTLADVPPGVGYTGAIAIRSTISELKCWQVPTEILASAS